MIVAIEKQDFDALYRTQIERDFPRSERRPLFAIRGLFEKGRYHCLTWQHQGEIQAYACFLSALDVGGSLLDYFAVSPQKRGGGLGSTFLKAIQKEWTGSGILIESELPGGAKTEADRTIRSRRIAFYEKNGAEATPWGWHAFGVDYALLWLPGRLPLSGVDAGAEITALYEAAMPRFAARMNTRLFSL